METTSAIIQRLYWHHSLADMLACRFCGRQANIDKPAYLQEQLDYDTNITLEL